MERDPSKIVQVSLLLSCVDALEVALSASHERRGVDTSKESIGGLQTRGSQENLICTISMPNGCEAPIFSFNICLTCTVSSSVDTNV